jgi:hypothetical protein
MVKHILNCCTFGTLVIQLYNTSVYASEEYELGLWFNDDSCSGGSREESFGKVYKHVFTHRCKC